MKARIQTRLSALLTAILSIQSAVAQNIRTDSTLQKAKALYQSIEFLDINPSNGTARSVRGILAKNVQLVDEGQVKHFLRTSKDIFRMRESVDDFTVKKRSQDKQNMTHLKLQQTYKGIPVFGSELILHGDGTNTIVQINGRFTPDVDLDVVPALSSEAALTLALAELGPADYRWLNVEQEKIIKHVFHDPNRTWRPRPELMVVPRQGDFDRGEYRLAWVLMIPVEGVNLGNWTYFVDAKTGEILHKFNAMPDITGLGVSNYNSTVYVETQLNGSTYEMIDPTRGISTYTAGGQGVDPGTLLTDSDNYWDQNPDAVDAHWGIGKVYDFYSSVFGRSSFDNNGADIINTVEYRWGADGNNALWNNGQIQYGMGDGSRFSSLTSLDCCGHEFTHGVNDAEYGAGSVYYGEYGALNEALSDIFATAIEFYVKGTGGNWWISEDCFTPNTPGDALRKMDDPNSSGDVPQPDTYLGTYWQATANPSRYNDWGGVHYNSGVLNYAFYLMTTGGSGTNDFQTQFTVAGIGIEKTRAIAYRAVTEYFTTSTDYHAARTAFLSAASDLFGSTSTEYKSVSDAFGAVGIGVKLIVKNGFEAGTIKVNNTTQSSGYTYFAMENAYQSYEAIAQYYDPSQRVWNASGVPASISNWRRQRVDQTLPQPIQGATAIAYSFYAGQMDNGATFFSDLKKQYDITRVDQSEFDGSLDGGVVAQVVESNTTSISAPAQQVINGRDCFFVAWADGVTVNPRNITPSDNVTLTACYKVHLKSTVTSAAGSSSQRKIAVCGSSSYAVYASAGRIWFTKNVGSGWSNEALISSIANGFAKNPSIAAFVRHPGYEPPNVVVAWEDQSSLDDPVRTVHYRVSIDDGQTWEPIKTMMGQSEYEDALPVIDGVSSDWALGVLVWGAYYGSNRSLLMAFYPPDDRYPDIPIEIPGADGTNSRSPSLARSSQGNWHLVYENGGQIVYREFTLSQYSPTFLGSPTVISGSYSGCAKPSVAVSASGTVVTVAWEASGTGGVRIVTRQRTSGVWSTPVELSHGTHAGHSPSIGIDDNAQTQTLAFECDTHIGLATRPLTSGSWSAVQDLGQGNAPSLCDNNLASPLIAFTQGTSAPYSIRLGTHQQYVQTLAEENKSLYSAASHNNSGRHLAVGNGKFHELFMSSGEVFYRRQNRSDGAWEKTVHISNAGGSVTLDALCRMSDGSLHAVWEELISGTSFRIKYSRSSDGDAWSAPIDLETNTTASTNQWSTYPTIGYIGTKLVVVHCYTGGLRCKVSTDGGLTWPSTWNPITTSYPSYVWYPSLTTFSSTLWLSYDYRFYGVFVRSFNGTIWSSETDVSTATGTLYGRCSSITSFGPSTMVAFCAQKTGQSEYRSVARWGTEQGITQFLEFPRIVGVYDFYPSVTRFWEPTLSSYLHMLASYTSDNRVRLWTFGAGYSPTIYDERFLTTDGAYAQLADEWEMTSPYAATVQWTGQQGNPHTVGLWSGRTLGKLSIEKSLAHSRRLVLGDTTDGAGTTLAYELSPLKMLLASGDTVIVPFKRYGPLGTLTKDPDSLLSYLGSEDFDVPAGARSLIWGLSVEENAAIDTLGRRAEIAMAFPERTCSVELSDTKGTTRWSSARITGATVKNATLMDLSRLSGRKLHMAIKDIAPLKKGKVILGLGDVFSEQAEDSLGTLAKAGVEMPTVYGLSEAYPNPFNPTTQLDFALPVPGSVSLVVYDILGREVATLAKGAYEAGYHSVRWDAAAKASGMYFVRLMVRDDLGGVSFTKVNKLLLMK